MDDEEEMRKYFAPLDIVGAPPKNTKFATTKDAENVWNDKMYKVLRETFQYDEFRGKQKEVILNTLAGLLNKFLIVNLILQIYLGR